MRGGGAGLGASLSKMVALPRSVHLSLLHYTLSLPPPSPSCFFLPCYDDEDGKGSEIFGSHVLSFGFPTVLPVERGPVTRNGGGDSPCGEDLFQENCGSSEELGKPPTMEKTCG